MFFGVGVFGFVVVVEFEEDFCGYELIVEVV